MQILFIMAALAALIIAESAPVAAVESPTACFTWAILGMAIVVVSAAVTAAVTAISLRRDIPQWRDHLQRFSRLRTLHYTLLLVVAAGILYRLGWSQLVRYNWQLQHSLLLDELLILVPLLLPLLLTWLAYYEVERALVAGLPSGHGSDKQPLSRSAYLGLHVRNYLAIGLVPLFGLVALDDALRLVVPGFQQSELAWTMLLPPAILTVVAMPLLLRWIWRTEPLAPGPMRTRLEEAGHRLGFRATDILIWNSENKVVNAAVAGLLPQLRYVFLSDGLLQSLGENEVEAIYGHEVGHIKCRHLLLRGATILAPSCLGLAAWKGLFGTLDMAAFSLQLGAGPFSLPVGPLVLMMVALYIIVVFGYYSRRLEQEADLFGCYTATRSSGGGRGPSASSHSPTDRRLELSAQGISTFVIALEKLAIHNGIQRQAASWQHGSIAGRVAFLRRVAREPQLAERFRRRLGWASYVWVMLMLVSLILLILPHWTGGLLT